MFSHVCWHRRPGEAQHSFTSAGTAAAGVGGHPAPGSHWAQEGQGKAGLREGRRAPPWLRGTLGDPEGAPAPTAPHLPMQERLKASLWKPGLQSQRWDPGRLWHTCVSPQWCSPVSHSSTSGEDSGGQQLSPAPSASLLWLGTPGRQRPGGQEAGRPVAYPHRPTRPGWRGSRAGRPAGASGTCRSPRC